MKRKTIFWHSAFWLVYMGIFTFVEGGYQNEFLRSFALEASFFPARLALVYFNYFVLLPRFLLRRKIEKYIGYTLGTIVVITFIQRALAYYFINPELFPDWNQGGYLDPYGMLQASMIITSPMIFLIGMTIIIRWASSEKEMERLAREKVETELKYLRNQVNPHFFFNTLNNLYGLAQEKSDKTAGVVLKLSELMTYMLYETNKPLISLEKELEYIRNYISLEEQRYEDRFQCSLSIQGDVVQTKVPPMLVLPFVENAFKHGINQESSGAWMSLLLKVEGEELYLKLENSLAEVSEGAEKKGGIGMINVSRRLDLLYPEGYSLQYGAQNGSYLVELKIDMKKLNRLTDEI